MRAGGDKRGNNVSRRARRAWLLRTFDPDLGDEQARCQLQLSEACADVLTIHTLTVDRIEPGGSYCHDNIQPACVACQNRQGALITWEKRWQWREWVREADEQGVEWDGVM